MGKGNRQNRFVTLEKELALKGNATGGARAVAISFDVPSACSFSQFRTVSVKGNPTV